MNAHRLRIAFSARRAPRRIPLLALLGAIPLAASALWLARRARHGALPRLLPTGRRSVELAGDIVVAAPVHEVFAFWSVIENFPRFMSHVREVARVGPKQYDWCVDGPAGAPVEWRAELTAFDPPRRIAWRSVPGSALRTSGGIRFQPLSADATRLRVRMRYTPPAGALGHALAGLLGADPSQQIQEDLEHFKALLEVGAAGATTRRELEPSTLG